MKMQLELKKQGSSILPYLYFIGLAAVWFFGELIALQNFSFAALGVMLVLGMLALVQNKVAGICLGLVATILGFVAFLAVISEFSDFEVVNQSAIELIVVGSLLSLTGLAMGILLLVTNSKTDVVESQTC